MLFVDTSHAANSYNARIVKNAHDDNIAVFSSSDQDTVSVERGDLGHGVFTHVVLRGLGGEAARDQEVRLFGFADFVDRRVRQLMADAQQPEINTQRVKNDVIARTTSQRCELGGAIGPRSGAEAATPCNLADQGEQVTDRDRIGLVSSSFSRGT